MSVTEQGGLTPGRLARRAGVNLQTIRYYERRGLLDPPPRTESNYRVFPPDAVARLRFIRRAQELGFTLEEIRELLSLRASPRANCESVRRRALEKMQEIDRRVGMLRRMKRALASLVHQCEGRRPATDCPILAALDERTEERPQ
ncbi:MAG: helix-turn-helix domain-containing protein [Acidobacteriota bacterium]